MNNPNVRSDGETQKQFNERRRSAQNAEAARAAVYFWYAKDGTYKKPETIIPQFKQTNNRTPKPRNKFLGFRKVRQFIPEMNMSVWVPA